MTDLTRLTAVETAAAISAKEVSAVEVAQAHLDRIAAVDGAVHAFLHVDTGGALAQAARVDAAIASGELTGPLAGVPLAMKDVIVTKGVPTTVGSRMLEGWRPPYDATISTRLRQAGVVVLGKTNMDEFAMGSSTEHSAYGPTHNPWDLTRIPGGSGGGSAAAVAAYEAPLAVGTDTGGSIRQPASVTGTVGVKPTYGGVSRYGLVAFSSSLDQAGPCARTVLDAALLHEAMAGHDPADSTSIDAPVPPVVEAARRQSVRGLRVGVVKELTGEGYEPGVQERFDEAVALLTELGATVTEVSCPHFAYALPAYYLIAPSEASSNLARFDSVRYGLRVGDDGERSLEEVMSLTRDAGFGPEVKRRIILGTYALSSGYYDAYYGQAQKVRTLITRDFAAAFEQTDVLVSPASPGVAFPLGAKVDDPLAMYRQDLATIPSNLYGGPAMSLPVGLSEGLPVGLQVMAPTMRDELLYQVGGTLEAALLDRWGGPLLASAPELAVTRGELLQVSVERVVPASPQAVFALLADPRRHREVDGSGTLRDTLDGPPRLHAGARFGMRMQLGGPYSMTNTVVEFEEGRRIAWQPRPTNAVAALVIGGRIWRYELEPVDGGTLVRETWDIRRERFPLPLLAARSATRRAMTRTLERLEERLAA